MPVSGVLNIKNCEVIPALSDPSAPLAPEPCGSLSFDHWDDFPGRTAIESADGSWSYKELKQAVQTLAAYLRSASPEDGGPVCILAARNPGLVISVMATVSAGLPFVILDPAFPLQRTLRCVQLVKPVGVISVGSAHDVLSELGQSSEAMRGGFVLSLPPDKRMLLESVRAIGTRELEERRPASIDASSLLYVAFTSGSTGVPKAVLGEHGPVCHFLAWQRRQFVLSGDDRVSMLSGLGHDPLLRDVMLPLSLGATLCIPPAECFSVPNRLLEWMQASRITVCHLTPSVASLMLAGSRDKQTGQLQTLRYAFFGGEPLKYSLVQRFSRLAPHATIVNCYGTTETPQVVSFHAVGQEEIDGHHDLAGDTVPIGFGIDGVQLLVQKDDRTVCEVGEDGEIWVRSPYLAREVWDENGRSRQPFEVTPDTHDGDDKLYRTGDYGVYLGDGAVLIKGRRDQQVKIRGHRVEVGEVERSIASTPGLLSYHVDIQSDGEWGSRLVLYVVADSNQDLLIADLEKRLTEQLPDYMVPERIVGVANLPITPNGKVDVEQLRQSVRLSSTPKPASSAQCTEEQFRMLRLCREKLATPSLEPDDKLAVVGLNSLQAIMLACAIEQDLGVTITVQDLIDCGTPRKIADQVAMLRVCGAGPATSGSGTAFVSTNGSNSRLLPAHENLLVAVKNRLLQIVARVSPDVLRVKCHQWRGVAIGRDVSIGYDTVIETAYPWLVRIGNHVNIGMRTTIIAHFRGMASREKGAWTVEIGDSAFIGPGVTILPNVKIGKGAVVTAGSVVNSSIPAAVVAHGNPAVPIAKCGLPLSGPTTYAEFLRNLHAL